MTDEATLTPAVEALWRAVGEYLKATAADDSTEIILLTRMADARELAVMVEVQPTPRIGIAGTDSHGPFCKTVELRAIPRELNS